MVAGLFEFLLSLRESIKQMYCGRQGTQAWFCFFLEINLEYKVKEGSLPSHQLCGSLESTTAVSIWAEGQAGMHQDLFVQRSVFL